MTTEQKCFKLARIFGESDSYYSGGRQKHRVHTFSLRSSETQPGHSLRKMGMHYLRTKYCNDTSFTRFFSLS